MEFTAGGGGTERFTTENTEDTENERVHREAPEK